MLITLSLMLISLGFFCMFVEVTLYTFGARYFQEVIGDIGAKLVLIGIWCLIIGMFTFNFYGF